MKSDKNDERKSQLYLLAGSVADDKDVDWHAAESSAPADHRSTIRKLRLISQVSLANKEKLETDYSPTEGSEIPPSHFVGHTWGSLQIEEKIGAGSFGEVFRARDPNLEREVALKLYYPARSAAAGSIADLLSEGRLLARVQHPHVATVHGAERHGNQVGIWMEYIHGATLEEILQDQSSLSPEKAMQIARNVCRALAALHEAGIIHRDVKPSNIMRATDGRIVLMDLGVSRDMDSLDSGKIYGTPLFAAPEVLLDNSSSPQSDLYSVGVLLFLMVTGQYPVAGETLAEVRLGHNAKKIQRIRDLQPDLPEALIQIVEQALAPNPADRFTTASEFEQALGAAIGDALETGAMPTREILQRQRRNRLLWSIGAILSLVAVLLAGYLALLPNLSGDRVVPSDIERVLVSYLDNRTGDESLDPIGPMAANWISQGLAHAGVVNMIPTMTVLQAMYAVAAVDTELTDMERLRVLAEASAATIVLSGAYYLVSDSLRFQLQATDMRSEELLFSFATVSGPSDRPMETINQVRESVMGTMVPHFSPAQSVDMIGRPDLLHKPPSFLAYREYIAGIANFGVNSDQSLYHFERAVELDSAFMIPPLWIAAAYSNRGQPAKVDSIVQQLNRKRDFFTPFERHLLDSWNAGLKGPRGESLRQYKMAEKYTPQDLTINYLVGLCELNMNNPRGTIETYAKIEPPTWYLGTFGGNLRYWALARAYHHLGNYAQELATVNRAIGFHPNDMDFRANKVRALAALGRIQEIPAVIDECATIPIVQWPPAHVMCAAAKELRVQGQFDSAREFATQAIHWCNQQSDPHEYRDDLAEALRLADQWAEAQVVYEELAAENPDEIEYMGKLGTLAVRRGNKSLAREIFDTLRHLDRPYLKGEHTYWCACISALQGEHEQAIALLKEAWEQGLGNPDTKWRDMDLEPLRNFPPFQEMIKPKG